MKANIVNESERAMLNELNLDKDTYKKYNEMIFALMTNIYTLSKLNKDEIVISPFDRKNKICKCVLIAANFLSSAYGWDIKLDLPLFDYLITKRKFKDIKLKKHNKKNIVKFIDPIAEANYVSMGFEADITAWYEIYDKFYNNGKDSK